MRSSLPSSGAARRAHAVIAAAVIAVIVVASPAHAAAPVMGSQSVAPQGEPQAPVCSGTGAEATTCSSGDQADGADQAVGTPTVGDGTVITDPADEVDGQPSSDSPPKRGERHVLGGVSRSSVPDPAPAVSSSSQTQTAPVAETAVSSPSATARGTLPFTGVNAGYLALAGIALVGSGLGARRLAASW